MWKAKFSRKLEYGNSKKSGKAKTERKLLVKNQILPKIVTENRFYTKFKFVKINTVCNNSLLQWRLLDLLGMAQLLNWKFCFIFVIAWFWWFATESKLVKRCIQCIFRTYAERFAPIFRKKINENCNRKILRDNEKLNLNFVENLQRQFSDFSNLETILNRKTLQKIENRTKLCG